MDRLKDKVCVITGADGGICHKASEFFCAEGAKVVMVDIDPAVEAKCAEIVANGGDAIAITADVSKRETWHLILEKTLEKYGTVDCVATAPPRSPATRTSSTASPTRSGTTSSTSTSTACASPSRSCTSG